MSTDGRLNIRKKELIDNPQTRVAVALVLDSSASMEGEPISRLNNGVRLFLDAVKKDNVARYSAEICMVTFGGIAELYQDFTSVDNINFYDLEADGATPMEDAVLLALDALERRKQEYKDCGVEYYQPWMVIMTDGHPYPDPLVNSYKKHIS